MTIVPDDTEMRERQRLSQERLQRVTEGKSLRFRRRMERVARTEWVRDIPTVRVLPKSDRWREIMVHPNGNLGFPKEGSAEWPLDQFTLRRLHDGDITLDQSHAETARIAKRVEEEKPQVPTRHAGGARADQQRPAQRRPAPQAPPRPEEPPR
jgi:hypothetical protein